MNSWPRAAKAGVEACKYSCCCFVSSVKCNHAITTSTTASPDTGTILKATRSTSCWSAKLGYRPSNLIPTPSGHVATELQKQEAGDLSVNLLISDDAAIVLKDAPDTRLSCPVNLEIPSESLLQHSQTPAPAAPPMPAIQRRRRRGKSRRGRADKAAATAAAAAVPAATTRIAHDCHVSADIPSFCQDNLNPGAATASCVSDEADACPCVQSRLPLTSPQPRVEVHAVTGDVLILEPPVDNLQHLFESVDHALSEVPGLSADDVALRRETAASPLLAVGLHSVIPTAPSLPVDACPFVPALPTAGAACPFSSLIPESPVEIRLAASGPYSQAEAGMDLSAANRQATMASSALRADARPFVPLVAPTLFIAEEEAAAAEAAAVPAATTRTAHDCHVSADIPSLCQDNAGAATASCVSDEADACPCVQSRLPPTSPQLRVEALVGDVLILEPPVDNLQHLFESVDHALSEVPGLSADDVALRRETAASPLLAVGLHSVIPTAPSLPVDACPFVPALPTAGAACPFSSLIPESPVEIRLAASGPYSQAEAGMDLSAANRQATMASSALRADARPFVPLVAPTLFIAEEEAAAAEAAAVPAATTRTAHDCHVSADIPSLCQDNAGAATASCVSDEADACPCVQSRLPPTSPQLRVEVLAATGDSLLPEQRSEEPFDKLQAQVKVILITHNSVCNGNCCCCFLGLASSLLTVWQLLLLWQLC